MNWHRLFGLILIDFFHGTPYVVEFEKDLSAKKQLLDVVVVRKGKGRLGRRPPDGLDNLAEHNLITFKSHHQSLDDWALKELTGHYVNYRKQVSPSFDDLLPEEQIRLFAVCSRFPQNLADVGLLESLQQGVYQCLRGTDLIRAIVACELPQQTHNAPLHLFSARLDELSYGKEHFRQHCKDSSSVLQRLLRTYRKEGVTVAYTMQDFRRDNMIEELKEATPEQRRDVLKHLSTHERLEGLSEEEIKAYLERRAKPSTPRKRKKL